MDIATIIVLLAVVLMLLAYLLQPFFMGGDAQAAGRTDGSAGDARQRAELLAERNRIYAEIRALDFDHATEKVSDTDYETQRHALVAQGVETLKQIDTLDGSAGAKDPIEAAVVAIRTGVPLAPKVAPVRKAKAKPKSSARGVACPHCGEAVRPGDVFCASCGNKL